MLSSSPTTPVLGQSLLGVFNQVHDPRARRGRRHGLATVLGIATAAVCAGARSLAAIFEWATDVGRDALTAAGVLAAGQRVASESTIRRTLQALDADQLSTAVGAWLLARDAAVWNDKVVVAIDGKTLRGARTQDTAAPHLLAAITTSGIVAGQHQITAKTSEITALPLLLDSLPVKELIITADALHTQRSTAAILTRAGHDYVLTVKGNQPKLRAALKKLPWVRDVTYDEDRHQLRTGHGPAVMATIRNTAISLHRLTGASNIAQALKHTAHNPLRPLQLITQP